MSVEIPKTPGLTDEQIEAIERTLACTLPASLKAFARDHDGATPADNTFDLPNNQSGVRSFVSLSEASSLRQRIEGFPKTGVPIAEDSCGNYVWIKPETGEVMFWDHEVDDDGIRVANDFSSFVAGLRAFDPTSVSLNPNQVYGAWIDPDFLAELKERGEA